MERVNFSKQFKLRTDLFHHTHEVWGPCKYKNTPLRGLAGRVLASYCGFVLFAVKLCHEYVAKLSHAQPLNPPPE